MRDLINRVRSHRLAVPASAGVAGFAVGFATSYFYARYQRNLLTMAYAELLHEALEGETEEEVHEEPSNFTITMSEEAVESMRKHPSYVPDQTEDDTPEAEEEEVAPVVSIFPDTDDDWDMEAEEAKRSPDRPYIIHVEEFLNDERGFAQTTLTYYEGDEILTDDKDVPVYNKADTVGELKFGHGSNDANVVYIRNEKLKAEFEVLRDSGYYEHEVLGIDIATEFTRRDLKHANMPRYRMED